MSEQVLAEYRQKLDDRIKSVEEQRVENGKFAISQSERNKLIDFHKAEIKRLKEEEKKEEIRRMTYERNCYEWFAIFDKDLEKIKHVYLEVKAREDAIILERMAIEAGCHPKIIGSFPTV